MMAVEEKQGLSQAIEDYLKVIYGITLLEKRASTMEISSSLGHKPASVTGMLQKLASTEPPLVEYRKYQGAVLTEEGKLAALETIRHHRLLETFLHQILGFSWDEVHDEAEKLEHVISEEFEERIAAKLGHPSYDPHGAPIPSRELEMPAFSTLKMVDLQPGESALVQRVCDENSDVLRYLEDLGLLPGVMVVLEDILPVDGNLCLRMAGSEDVLTIGPQIASMIHVERAGDQALVS